MSLFLADDWDEVSQAAVSPVGRVQGDRGRARARARTRELCSIPVLLDAIVEILEIASMNFLERWILPFPVSSYRLHFVISHRKLYLFLRFSSFFSLSSLSKYRGASLSILADVRENRNFIMVRLTFHAGRDTEYTGRTYPSARARTSGQQWIHCAIKFSGSQVSLSIRSLRKPESSERFGFV